MNNDRSLKNSRGRVVSAGQVETSEQRSGQKKLDRFFIRAMLGHTGENVINTRRKT